MPTQKWCNQAGCKEFVFAKLDDFSELGWGAYQIPNGKGKVKCWCPKHQEEMNRQMVKDLEYYSLDKKEVKHVK